MTRTTDNRSVDDMLHYYEQDLVPALKRRIAEPEQYVAILELPEVYGQNAVKIAEECF